MVLDGDELYASTRGEVFRLDPATGRIYWKNGLPGLGHGLIAIAAAGSPQVLALREKQRRDDEAAAAAAAAASSGD